MQAKYKEYNATNWINNIMQVVKSYIFAKLNKNWKENPRIGLSATIL